MKNTPHRPFIGNTAPVFTRAKISANNHEFIMNFHQQLESAAIKRGIFTYQFKVVTVY